MTAASKKTLSARLAMSLLLLMATPVFSSSIPEQGFSLTWQSFSSDDFNFSGPSLYLRKTLQQDTLSLKGQYNSFNIEDESSDQISTAPDYSETQSTIALGVDYFYYDSSLSLFGHYTSEDSSNDSAIGIDLTQSYGRANSYLRMGFSHGWEDDSDLGLHNKTRKVHLGNGRTIKSTWQIYAELAFASSDGDLQDFRSARRFSNTTRVALPTGRSDQQLRLVSSNDLGKNRFLKTELQLLNNDWGQSGNSVEFSLLKARSERFALQYHVKLLKLDESKYFTDDVVVTPQAYFSDHRHLSAQEAQELGVTGKWKLGNNNPERRLRNIGIDAGYTYMKNEYANEENISNSGSAIFINFSGNF